MEPQQRATPLVPLPRLLAGLGAPLAPVFAGTGIGPEDLRPDAFIPFSVVPVLLERAAALSGCEDLGLRLGRQQSLASIGPAGRIMASAATLGEALSDFVAVQISNSTASSVYLNRVGDDFAFGYGIYQSDLPPSPQLYDLALSAGNALVQELTHGALRPLEIVTMRPAPRDPMRWTRAAGCPVRFGQPESALILPRASLGFRLPTADPAAHTAMLASLAPFLKLAPWGKAGEVTHALRAMLLAGHSRMPEVAAHLGTTPRTLRRALLVEGTTFGAIRDRVRFAMARELLTLTALPIADIALTLDFATPSAFVRAFRRWTARPPTAWRAQSRASM